MAYGLIWAPAARLDLKNLAAYIAEDNPAAALGTLRLLWFFVKYFIMPRGPRLTKGTL